MSFETVIVILVVSSLAAGVGLWLLFRGEKKSLAERERERRLAVNAVGRLTDGILTEAFAARGDSRNSALVYYRYSVSGVEYSAAQDISGLRQVVREESCWPGSGAAVKYDPQNPSNSILVCEHWSGLGVEGKPGPGNAGKSPPRGRLKDFGG